MPWIRDSASSSCRPESVGARHAAPLLKPAGSRLLGRFCRALRVPSACFGCSDWRFRVGLILTFFLFLSSVATQCIAIATPTPTSPPPTATPTPLPPTRTPTATFVPPTPTPEPVSFAFGLDAPPVRLDPALAMDRASAWVSAQIYDTLVRFKPGTTEIEPGLAEAWEVSPDGRIWEFTLREGVRFHDGTPLDAEAVVWNFQRWMDPQHPAHQGDFPFWKGMFGGFLGETDLEGNPASLVVAVEAVDSRTVRVTLHQPFAPLLHNLAMPAFAILSPHAVDAQGPAAYGTDAAHPGVGTGPFRLVDWQEDRIVLEGNRDYWAGRPRIGRLVFRVIPEPRARLVALRRGEIQGMVASDLEGWERMRSDPQVQVVLRSLPTTAFLVFNFDDERLRKRAVRQAIAHAIDRKRLVREQFGPAWRPADQILPSGFWGYNPDLVDYIYDPERARRLLAAAGYPDGFETALWYPDRPRPYLPDPEGVARAIAEDLAAVGIQAQVYTEHWSAYLAERRQGGFPMWLLGWTGYNGDPDSFFFFHFGIVAPREGNYDNRELRELLLQAQMIPDDGMRLELYHRAAEIVHDDVPRLFLAHPREVLLFSREVVRYAANPVGPEAFFGVTLRRSRGNASA